MMGSWALTLLVAMDSCEDPDKPGTRGLRLWINFILFFCTCP